MRKSRTIRRTAGDSVCTYRARFTPIYAQRRELNLLQLNNKVRVGDK